MNRKMETWIETFIQEYTEEHRLDPLWQRPIVKFADAKGEAIRRLPSLVHPAHFSPRHFLPDAENVLSFFLPFREEVATSNLPARHASPLWAAAYRTTNAMALQISHRLVQQVHTLGYRAAVPQSTGLISPQDLYSRWSQRHLAYLAGHGSFGINHMLISDKGSCGRYFSIVTTLPATTGTPLAAQRCLYKLQGSCGVCLRRCPSGALTADSFNREKCYAFCLENAALYSGADVCGKCVVGLPCSFI